MKKGVWLTLQSGRRFWPMDPSPGDIRIEDISHALSYICRFGGHTRVFYSVAEHSVHVCDYLKRKGHPENILKWGLLHDATEAYCGDVIRPIKRILPDYSMIEDGIMGCIALRFGLDQEMPEDVKYADNVVLASEIRDLLNTEKWMAVDLRFVKKMKDDSVGIKALSPIRAKRLFTRRFKELFGAGPGQGGS